MNICIKCKEEPIYVQKRRLCRNCYQKWYLKRKENLDKNDKLKSNYGGYGGTVFPREIEFIKNFFTHQNWYYAPAIFRANGFRYEPDFYDNERGVFIEVAGTRQAFQNNRKKYIQFTKTFPHLKFEIRKTDGVLIDINNINNRQTWPQ